jgi:RimJ/RimL family protein N-acetyltransferase
MGRQERRKTMFARTERLLLRPGWKEDAPALFQAIADEGIVRNLASPPWPYRLADAEAFLAAERRPDETCFLIFRRTRGAPQLIGTTGFGRMPSGQIELGYWIAREHWGLGYATEAAGAAIAIARDSLRLNRLVSGHFLDNPASGRVLQKLGFRSIGIVAERFSAGRGGNAPCKLFERDLRCELISEEPPCPEQAMAA